VNEPRIEYSSLGKYEILGILGKGAMGVVYRGRDPEIGRLVAVKTLRKLDLSRGGSTESALERFRNEARSAGNLRHANIVTIFEVNCQGNVPYIVMDYVDGASLDSLLKRYRRLAPGLVISYLAQVASALDYAHGKGVIHRDVKPSNILVDRSDHIFVLDFGVASMNHGYDAWEGVKSEAVVGTPSYMSPEQIQNQRLDRRSDIFSLAVVAFELLAGSRPFPGDDFNTVISSIVKGRHVALSAVASDLPLALEAEFERALSLKREHRFNSSQEMIRAFAKALGIELPGAISLSLSGQSASGALIGGVSDGADIGMESPGFSSRSHDIANPITASPSPRVPQSKSEDSARLNAQAWAASRTNSAAGIPLPTAGAGSSGAGHSSTDSSPIDWADPGGSSRTMPAPPAKIRGKSAGDLFAHVPETVSEQASRNAVFVETPRRRQQWGLLAGGILAVVGVGYLIISGDTIEPPPPTNSLNLVRDQVAVSQVGGPFASGEHDLIDPVGEIAPAGIAVSAMTPRQLIGVLKRNDVSEIEILAALREAKSRRLPQLVDVSVYPLRSDSYLVRIETVKVLAELGDKRIVPRLMIGLDDHDPLVRGHTARALGQIGDSRALGYLRARLTKEDSPEVKIAIKRAIERISGIPVP